jgi:hypothetical protein
VKGLTLEMCSAFLFFLVSVLICLFSSAMVLLVTLLVLVRNGLAVGRQGGTDYSDSKA